MPGMRIRPARELFAANNGGTSEGRHAVEFGRSALSASDAVGRLRSRRGGRRCCAARRLLLLEVNHWLALILAAGFVLFALFLVRTALRHHTRYLLGPDTLCADGPAGAVVEWNRLDRLKLSYFSTKRDRSDGWMQLTVGSAGGRTVKIDSSLDGFHDVVERAAQAAGTRRA